MTARAELILGLRGNLVQGLQQAQQQFSRTSQIGSRAMQTLSRAAQSAGRGIDMLGNRYAALATGAAALGSARFVVGHELRLTRLGIAANLSANQVDKLNQKIFETAQQSDIRVDSSEILAAVEAIVEKTGDLGFAEKNLRNIGLAIQATGAGGSAVGELLAEFQKLGEKDSSKLLVLLDTLNVQGKIGAFTLQNLAALGPRVVTAYAGSVHGLRDNATVMKEMGAALQVIRQGTGSSEQAATAFERLLSDLQDATKQKLFKKMGVEVFELGKGGVKSLRPINELMDEIYAKTKGNRTELGRVMGDESIRSFNAYKPELMASFMAAQGDGTETMRDSARAAGSAAAAMASLATVWKQFADTNLAPALQGLADGLNSVGPKTVANWLESAKAIGAVLGLIYGANKIFKIAKWGGGILGGAGGLAQKVVTGTGGFGGALAGVSMGNPLPVRVVNGMPGSGGSFDPSGPAGAAGGKRSTMGKVMRGGAALAAVAGVGYEAYQVGGAIYDEHMAGKVGGDMAGAFVTTIAAWLGNEEAKRAKRDMDLTPEQYREGKKVQSVIRLELNQLGKLRLDSMDVAPGLDLTVASGPLRSLGN